MHHSSYTQPVHGYHGNHSNLCRVRVVTECELLVGWLINGWSVGRQQGSILRNFLVCSDGHSVNIISRFVFFDATEDDCHGDQAACKYHSAVRRSIKVKRIEKVIQRV
jgi:hypothetical protein